MTGECSTARELRQHFLVYVGIDVSEDTFLRMLHRHRIRSRYKKKRPQLTKTHRRHRREFELSHRDWDCSKWGKVFWSDETRICLRGSDGHARCFRRDGERLLDHQVSPVTKYGGGSIML